ncbi:MAG: hypothetical protein PW843_28865 [Azospirillaceae bacterium]|nr:hypothetical protein [Azospirillaceae bacterium]
MKANINAILGLIYLGNQIILQKGLNISTARSSGINILREDDMKTGWIYILTGPYDFDGDRGHVSLSFFNGNLNKISISLTRKNVSMEDLAEVHKQYLEQKLGPPDTQDRTAVRYLFQWGSIASSYDPRGGSSSIIISWS